MKLGITLVGDSLRDFVRYAKQADAAGISAIGIGDSQSLHGELWIRCALAGANTSHSLIGPVTTNPITRHPAVTASAAAALAELTDGRAFLGISPGDSAVYNIGLKPAKLSELERAIRTIRELLDQGEAEWEGKTVGLHFSHPPVRIGIPASGPRALRLAGKVADIVWVCTGLTPELVRAAQESLAEGAAEVGRSLDDIDVWWIGLLHIHGEREVAIRDLIPSFATYAHIIFRYSLAEKAVPPEKAEAVKKLVNGYQPRFHRLESSESPNARLVEDLGLTEFLAERLGIFGTVDECLERLSQLEKIGVKNVWSPVRVPNKQLLMNNLCEDLLPKLAVM